MNKWRLSLSLSGKMVYLSHLDLLASFERALRRSGLPVSYSSGFNPHMLISWGPAHPVGVGGDNECCDLVFTEPVDQQWPQKLNTVLPDGMRINKARPLEDGAVSLMAAINYAQYIIELENIVNTVAFDAAIERLLDADSYVIERISPKGRKRLDIRSAIDTLKLDDNLLYFGCRLGGGPTPKISELADILGVTVCSARRTGLFIDGNNGRMLP